MTLRPDLRPDHWDIVCEILREHVPDRRVLAFGSRATWTAKDYSDLDLAVLGEEPLPLNVTSALTEEFSESDLPFRVDIVEWARIDETMRDEIRRDGLVVKVAVPKSIPLCRLDLSARKLEYKRWRRVSLNEVIDVTLSSVDKKSKENERNVRLCNYMDVYNNVFIHANMNFMPATATENEIKKCTLISGDVVITKDSEKYDDIGVPALVKENVRDLVCGYHLAILRPRLSEVDGAYLLYALSTRDAQKQFHSYSNGITRFGLRKYDIGLIEIPLPPLPEQHTIAHILGTLDEKIESNRYINQTLEDIARTLFKSWFVDFDPVRAKMEGRNTGLPDYVSDLFPARFVDTHVGPIPEGWMIGTLRDIADSPRRMIDPTSVKKTTPYIGLEHMPRRSISLSKWGSASKVTSTKSSFKSGELLFGKLRPYFHKVGMAPVDGICSTDIVVIIPKLSNWSAFTLACLSSDQFIDYTNQTSTGTRMPRTSWKTMASYELCLPNLRILNVFQNIVGTILSGIVTNILESHTLEKKRDILLPKLISGEMRCCE